MKLLKLQLSSRRRLRGMDPCGDRLHGGSPEFGVVFYGRGDRSKGFTPIEVGMGSGRSIRAGQFVELAERSSRPDRHGILDRSASRTLEANHM